MDLHNKIALVIGAGEMPGSSIAIELARAGAKVVVEGSAGVQEKVLRTVETFGGDALPIRGDMAVETDVKHVVANIEAILGDVDIVVNVYPTRTVDTLIEETSYDQWDQIQGNKIRATFLCCKVLIPSMKRRGSGQIISIGSSQLVGHNSSQTAITASEYGVIGLSNALAKELAGTGIQVLYMSPVDHIASTQEGTFDVSAEGLDSFAKSVVLKTKQRFIG
ncbi:MAG: hypothetical protein CL891_03420 [Dehalococcoidia bacterium]|nr:hypothetical protein [Dehalococcoidia bacterium]